MQDPKDQEQAEPVEARDDGDEQVELPGGDCPPAEPEAEKPAKAKRTRSKRAKKNVDEAGEVSLTKIPAKQRKFAKGL